MTEWEIAGTVFTIGGVVATLVVQIRGGVWNAANRENELKTSLETQIDAIKETFSENINKLRSETVQNLAEINRDMIEGIGTVRKEASEAHMMAMRSFGETIASLKEKVNTDALEAERRFLRREDYYEHSRITEKAIDNLKTEMNSRFNQISQKLD